MQSSLCRACTSCIRAKKRCDRGLPKCWRCANKHLSCSYQNEPLGCPSRNSTPTNERNGNLTRANYGQPAASTVHRACQNGELVWTDWVSISRITDPAVFLPMDVDSLVYMIRHLLRCPLDFVRNGGTDFIHPSFYRQYCPGPLQVALEVCKTIAGEDVRSPNKILESTDPRTSARALLAVTSSLAGFIDLLAFVQSLCLLQIMAVFSTTTTRAEREEGVRRQQLLVDWTTKLWERAPSSLPSTFSKHEAYVLAEAVRRTILVSHKIQGCFSVLRKGVFRHTLFFESLPFGAKAALWDADPGAAELDTKDTHLLSFREYCDLWDAGLVQAVTPFERMLLVGGRGRAAVDERLGTTTQ